MLSAVVFATVNSVLFLVYVLKVTVLSLLSNSLLLAILCSCAYHASAYAYLRVTKRRLAEQLKSHVGFDLAELDVSKKPPTIAVQSQLGHVAGALEGGANVLLQSVWTAVMLHSWATTCRVFAVAYLLSRLGTHLDLVCWMWLIFGILFTAPKLWASRPPLVDEKMVEMQVEARRRLVPLKDRVVAVLPFSVMAKAL